MALTDQTDPLPEIDILIERLKAMADENFGYAPDDITWGAVRILEHHAALLKRIV